MQQRRNLEDHNRYHFIHMAVAAAMPFGDGAAHKAFQKSLKALIDAEDQ